MDPNTKKNFPISIYNGSLYLAGVKISYNQTSTISQHYTKKLKYCARIGHLSAQKGIFGKKHAGNEEENTTRKP